MKLKINYRELAQTFFDELGVEVWIKNKKDKPLSEALTDYIWHCFLAGAMVDSMGGIKKVIGVSKKATTKKKAVTGTGESE